MPVPPFQPSHDYAATSENYGAHFAEPPNADIIAAIDQAVGCQQCGNPLGSSPSSDFCSEYCQRMWQASRVGATAEPSGTVREFAFGGPLHVAPVGTPYELGGETWIPLGYSLPRREYRAHFEIQQDGSVVDNTPFIRERQRNANSTLRSFLGGEEVWWP